MSGNVGAIILGPGNGGAVTANAGITVYGGAKILSIGMELGTNWYPINKFFNLVVVRNNPNSYLYLNGNLIFTDTPIGTFGSSYNAIIGDWGGRIGDYAYNGKISNTCFYNRALTQLEITQNYNALKGRFGYV